MSGRLRVTSNLFSNHRAVFYCNINYHGREPQPQPACFSAPCGTVHTARSGVRGGAELRWALQYHISLRDKYPLCSDCFMT